MSDPRETGQVQDPSRRDFLHLCLTVGGPFVLAACRPELLPGAIKLVASPTLVPPTPLVPKSNLLVEQPTLTPEQKTIADDWNKDTSELLTKVQNEEGFDNSAERIPGLDKTLSSYIAAVLYSIKRDNNTIEQRVMLRSTDNKDIVYNLIPVLYFTIDGKITALQVLGVSSQDSTRMPLYEIEFIKPVAPEQYAQEKGWDNYKRMSLYDPSKQDRSVTIDIDSLKKTEDTGSTSKIAYLATITPTPTHAVTLTPLPTVTPLPSLTATSMRPIIIITPSPVHVKTRAPTPTIPPSRNLITAYNYMLHLADGKTMPMSEDLAGLSGKCRKFEYTTTEQPFADVHFKYYGPYSSVNLVEGSITIGGFIYSLKGVSIRLMKTDQFVGQRDNFIPLGISDIPKHLITGDMVQLELMDNCNSGATVKVLYIYPN